MADCSAYDLIEALVSTILAVISLVGNGFVLLIVLRNISMQTPVNYLLVNLAVADMISSVFVLPRFTFKFIFIHPQGPVGDLLCKFIRDLSWVGGQASAFTLIAIAFERRFAILHPHRGLEGISKGKLKFIIAVSWVYGVVLELPSIYSSKFNRELRICDGHWDNQTIAKIYSVALFAMNFIFPLLTMSFAYFGIVKRLWGHDSGDLPSASNTALIRFRKRVTLVVLGVTISYGVCWFPLPLFYMLYHLTRPNAVVEYNSVAYNMAVMLVSLNSCLDPFMYSLQSERFGRVLRKMLCPCCGRKSRNPRRLVEITELRRTELNSTLTRRTRLYYTKEEGKD